MKEEYLGINIDLERDSMFSESGLQRLKDGYMCEHETSPQHRFAFVSKEFSSNPEHAQRLYDYSSKMWLSYATPILSYGKTKKSLPISCFASLLDDSMESILNTSSETRMLAVVGGGVGLHVGLRPGDRKSSGIIPHLRTYDADTLAFKQGTTRRGATAAYLQIDHPEIIEFLEMRKPTGGDPNRKCLNLHHGISITDDFMRRIELLSTQDELSTQEREELDRFPLVNPHTQEVTEYVSAKELWERLLTVRMETGEPYIWFIDIANKYLPQYQKDLGLRNNGSNLCLTGDTLVNVEIGGEKLTLRLDKVISLVNNGSEITIESKNLETGCLEFKPISNAAMTARNSQLILIEDCDSSKSIRCTPEHKIYTKNRGYVMAKDLLSDDILDII